jgi:hypothetical protein
MHKLGLDEVLLAKLLRRYQGPGERDDGRVTYDFVADRVMGVMGVMNGGGVMMDGGGGVDGTVDATMPLPLGGRRSQSSSSKRSSSKSRQHDHPHHDSSNDSYTDISNTDNSSKSVEERTAAYAAARTKELEERVDGLEVEWVLRLAKRVKQNSTTLCLL